VAGARRFPSSAGRDHPTPERTEGLALRGPGYPPYDPREMEYSRDRLVPTSTNFGVHGGTRYLFDDEEGRDRERLRVQRYAVPEIVREPYYPERVPRVEMRPIERAPAQWQAPVYDPRMHGRYLSHSDDPYDSTDDDDDSDDELVSLLDAMSDRAARKRQRGRTQKFDAKLASSLPSQKDVGTDSLIRQIESLFHVDDHRVAAAKLKLDESTLYLVDAEERRGKRLDWASLKILLGSKRKTPGSQIDFNIFQQRDDESIPAAWDRLLGIARSIDNDMTTSQLWDYFRDRLTSAHLLIYKAELSNPDPFQALAGIRKWGNVQALFPSPAKSLFRAEVEIPPTPSSGSKGGARVICYDCQQPGHIARYCPDKQNKTPQGPPPPPKSSDEPQQNYRGRGGGYHKGRGGHRGGHRGGNRRGSGRHWPKRPKNDKNDKADKPDDKKSDPPLTTNSEGPKAMVMGAGSAQAPTASAVGSTAASVRAFAGL